MIAAGLTVTSNSTLTLELVFSIFALLGQCLTIYVVIHNRQKEGTEKAVKDATITGEIKAQLAEFKAEFKTELGLLSKSVDATNKTVEKTDSKIDDVLRKVDTHDTRLTSLEQRVSKLEDRK